MGVEHPDGGEKQSRICKIPAQGGSDPSLTDGSAYVDGQWIYFNSKAVNQKLGHPQLYRMRPDGSNVQQLTHDGWVNWLPHFTDGQQIAYLSYPPGTEGHPPDRAAVELPIMNPDDGKM